ncbi:uncharacterized protein K02A2.6 [Trichonephila clavata]|uniref:Uncharacterized protein K02A2.6 n=1 Tax=Trichonephila clavata TaxID=2740835 RepID=A0A8X6J6I1_TRICU|nr:uncharacterized protein K02A2.6 [Trichonephila clavata]
MSSIVFLVVVSFARFGLPRVLVSDNGSQFTSYEFKRFMQRNGVKHKISAPFKPSSNGQAERSQTDLNKELGSSSVPEVPSTDVAIPDVSPSSAKLTGFETRNPPVPEKPFPRRSGRIRRSPERLVL